MFTGLIQDVGTVTHIHPMEGGGATFHITSSVLVPQLTPGASIAVNGCCTTAIAFDTSTFTVELSPETLACTTFGQMKEGALVNLELPLLPTSPLGGHYVTGHVDGCLELLTMEQVGEYWELDVALPVTREQQAWFIPKGSIALDGISLTVNRVLPDRFQVCIIPHTLAHTTLGQAKPGQWLHFEGDILGKYVQRNLALHTIRH
jgi:riboflavin synthase